MIAIFQYQSIFICLALFLVIRIFKLPQAFFLSFALQTYHYGRVDKQNERNDNLN